MRSLPLRRRYIFRLGEHISVPRRTDLHLVERFTDVSVALTVSIVVYFLPHSRQTHGERDASLGFPSVQRNVCVERSRTTGAVL